MFKGYMSFLHIRFEEILPTQFGGKLYTLFLELSTYFHFNHHCLKRDI
jgi:hypothetical protein